MKKGVFSSVLIFPTFFSLVFFLIVICFWFGSDGKWSMKEPKSESFRMPHKREGNMACIRAGAQRAPPGSAEQGERWESCRNQSGTWRGPLPCRGRQFWVIYYCLLTAANHSFRLRYWCMKIYCRRCFFPLDLRHRASAAQLAPGTAKPPSRMHRASNTCRSLVS